MTEKMKILKWLEQAYHERIRLDRLIREAEEMSISQATKNVKIDINRPSITNRKYVRKKAASTPPTIRIPEQPSDATARLALHS